MKQISTGIEDFKELIDNNYYYVDKTMLIEDVLSDVVLHYTRPRRFGKTLNMSMLYYFFSNKEKENAYLFDGLKISENKEIMKHQNQYPVIFMTLKDLSRENMGLQIDKFKAMVAKLVEDNSELIESPYLSSPEKQLLNSYRCKNVSESDLRDALYNLSIFLEKHYHQKVIILIDEYDVPLQSAFNHGYYDEMVNFLKSVFSAGLKTNDALERGILTGCLRIAKESIFTGLNNFTVRTITSQFASDCFGFTQKEIDDLLNYYDLISKRQDMKEWYDGYLFDNKEIYNPWSALNYIKELNGNNDFPAVSFWANTSSNDLVRQYIKNGTLKMKEEFEELINGKSIIKKVTPELTYREMDFKTPGKMNDDIYSFLLYTGYLKIKDKVYDPKSKELVQNTYELIIPNKEVKYIYEDIFMKWFEGYQKERKSIFVDALLKGDVMSAIDILSDVLESSISYYDSLESFYHGFMVGFLQETGYEVRSNKESGAGRFDIALVPKRLTRPCIILECKHSSGIASLIKDSQKAARQIEEKQYSKDFLKLGYPEVLGYGISFYKKQCIITKA